MGDSRLPVIRNNLEAFSAMFSSWFLYRPGRVLFDAGEGLCVKMRKHIFRIENVFLTHGHYDHISGLPGLVLSRNTVKGANDKPLTIHYPAGQDYVEHLREYIERISAGKLEYPLAWVPLREGDEVPLGVGRDRGVVRAFRTRHMRQPTLGYKVCRTRKRLRPEFAGMPREQLLTIIAAHGKAHIEEQFDISEFTLTGDTWPLDPALFADTEVLVHEATFLRPGDRDADSQSHSTFEEAARTALAAGVQLLVLYHVSHRYHPREIREALDRVREMLAGRCEVELILGNYGRFRYY